MTISLNANEVLAIAEEVKRNGAEFYRYLAGRTADSDTKRVLVELASMEQDQEHSFAGMRASLSNRQKSTTHFHPGTDEWIYLRQFAGSRVFDLSRDRREYLAGKRQVEEILKAAADLEKDSIIFFLELKRHILSRDRSDLVDKIIRRQMNNIVLLSNRIAEIKASLQYT